MISTYSRKIRGITNTYPIWQEDLHIVIRFHGTNKFIEFDADTAEDKYTICRLLGILLGECQIEAGPEGADENTENGVYRPKLSTRRQIIKEGILDKKGNTKIPTWSRWVTSKWVTLIVWRHNDVGLKKLVDL